MKRETRNDSIVPHMIPCWGKRIKAADAYPTTLQLPTIIDFAIPPANSEPCSRTDITMVERKTTGNTVKIPLNTDPTCENDTATAITTPASNPRKRIFIGV